MVPVWGRTLHKVLVFLPEGAWGDNPGADRSSAE
jgi:hypothetical protein